jgi:hypothetical protein
VTVWNILQLIATVVIAGTFVTSGVAKTRANDATGDTFAALGVPSAFRREWIYRSYPFAEIALGIAMLVLPAPVWWVAAAIAFLLLAVLTALVVRVVLSGDAVACNCFGSTQPLTRRTVVRNGLLVLLSVVALIADPITASPVFHASESRPDVLLAVAASALAAASVTALIMAGPGRPRESVTHENRTLDIPDVVVHESDGRPVRLPSLTTDGAVLLVHVKTGCGPCAEVIDALPDGSLLGGRVRVRLLEKVRASSPRPEGRLGDPDGAVASLLGFAATPSALLLAQDGTIPADPVRGSAQIFELADAVRQALAARGPIDVDDVSL